MIIALKKTRTLLAIVVAAALVFTAACNSGQTDTNNSDQGSSSSSSSSSPAPAETPSESELPSEVAEADPFGKYDPPVTITAGRKARPNIKFIEGEDYTDNVFSRELKSRLGIDLQYDWIVDESQYETKVNLAIASGDIPDAFLVTASQERQLIDAGLILDITDLFEQYASPLMKKIVKGNPDLYKTVLVDGRLYDIPMMPSIDFNINVLQVRKDWLDKLGLAPPKTADELWNVLDAFVNRDPDGDGQKNTVGLSLNKDLTKSVGKGDAFPLFAMYKAYPEIWLKDASGNLVYGSIQPEMKAALQNMQDLYKRGLIDPEFAVKDQGKVAEDIVSERSGVEFGVFWTPAYPWNDLKKKNTDADVYNLDIPSVDGEPVLSAVVLNPLQKLVVSKKAKHPEAIIKMINLTEDLWWGSSDLAEYWQGVLSDPKYADVGGVDTNIPLLVMEPPTLNYDLQRDVTAAVEAKDPNSTTIKYAKIETENSLKWLNEGALNHWGIWKLRVGPESATYISNMRQDNGNYLVSEFYGSPGPVQTEKSSTLSKMEKELFTKIIMNAAPVSDFDKFVEQWKASGGDDLTAEINAWYDAQPK